MLTFLSDVLYHPTADGGGSGTSGTDDNKDSKDENKKDGVSDNKGETITLTKAELEAKLQQKFAEGARKAQNGGGSTNTQNSQNTGTGQKNDGSNAINADEFNSVKNELELLRGEKLALKQGVKSDYTEDAVAILKGKGLEINEANMKAIIDKHPEWKMSNDNNDTGAAKPLGSTGGKTNPPSVSEAEQAAKLFGF